MKNRNNQLAAVLFVVALALAPLASAKPFPDGGPTYVVPNQAPQPGPGPTYPPANEAPHPEGGPISNSNAISPQDEQMPVITIHSTGNVSRGKTGSFVLDMKPALLLSATYVNFSVSGTAISGVDYVALVSPAYIGQSGYGTILVHTLADPRGLGNNQSYSVVVTLKTGLGYALGAPSSAILWITP